MLQQHNSLKTIKKKLIRKALDMIRRIADEDPDESTDKEKKGMVLNYGLHLIPFHGLRLTKTCISSTILGLLCVKQSNCYRLFLRRWW